MILRPGKLYRAVQTIFYVQSNNREGLFFKDCIAMFICKRDDPSYAYPFKFLLKNQVVYFEMTVCSDDMNNFYLEEVNL